MKTRLFILLATLAWAGCTTYQGGTGPATESVGSGSGSGYGYGQENAAPYPPTDFGRGGNRANPPPFDTQSGAVLPATDGMDLHGMESSKFPPAHR